MSLGCEVAKRVKKSLEVDLSHFKGFHLRFTPKVIIKVSGVTHNWRLGLHLGILSRIRNNQTCV